MARRSRSPLQKRPALAAHRLIREKIPMKSFASLVLVGLTLLLGIAQAEDSKTVIATLTERLLKIGAPHIEGTEKAGADKTAPGLYFGSRKINNNYDAVDDIKQSYGATATVFVWDGAEFVRVSTNVLTPEGKRGVGTTLARAKAYETLMKGEQFCGDVDVLGTAYSACYTPLKDAAGKVIGATYVGFKK
jgi:hypothetical protein